MRMLLLSAALVVLAALCSAAHVRPPPGTKLASLHRAFAPHRNALFDPNGVMLAPPVASAKSVGIVAEGDDPRQERQKWGYLNVLDFGATADGTTDDTAAFQAAIHKAREQQTYKVYVPGGHYLLNSTLHVPPYVVLEGVNEYPFSAFAGGTVLRTTANKHQPDAAPFIFLEGPDSGVTGMTIVYPDQDPSGSTPAKYPPCIRGSGNNLAVRNVLLGNPWIGIDFETNSCPRHLIENVYGQPIAIGIAVDQVYDIGRIRHVHFWPFWAPAFSNFTNWINRNGVTFRIRRSDWEVVEDVFSWGYNIGIQFASSSHGACNGQFTDVDFDNVNIGIDVQHTQPYGVMFANLNLANAGNGDTRVAINCQNTSHAADRLVVVRGLAVWGKFYHAVTWNCTGRVEVTDGVVDAWAHGDNHRAPVEAFKGEVGFRGIFFHQTSSALANAFYIGSNVSRAIVTGNDVAGRSVVCLGEKHLCDGNLS